MAVNSVKLSDGTVLIDLSADTVKANTMVAGVTAHDAAGNPITGTLKIITPKIGFGQGEMYAPATNVQYTPVSYSDYDITFQYRGGSGCEELLYPIKGLSAGAQYTISFDMTYNGSFIGDAYAYGCGIIQKATYDKTTYPTNASKPSFVQWNGTPTTGTQHGSLTFTAQADTVYWGWSLARIQDSVLHTFVLSVDVYAA